MNTYIGLLRGVNVGGNNKLPMKELVALLDGLGLHQVKSYIQSGNVVFQSERTDTAALASEITAAIGTRFGFAPLIFLLSAAELQAAISANPFPEGELEPKSLHLFFLDVRSPSIEWSKLEGWKAPSERIALLGNVFYLHAPDGIGRSQLAEKIGQDRKVRNTARNWRTVMELMKLAQE